MLRQSTPATLPRLAVVLAASLLAGCTAPLAEAPRHAEEDEDPPGLEPSAEAEDTPSGELHPRVVFSPDTCDPHGERGISRNAPWIALWQEGPVQVAAAYAAALGIEGFSGVEETEPGVWSWEDSDGRTQLIYDVHEGGEDSLTFRTAEAWPGNTSSAALEVLETLLARLALPTHVGIEPYAPYPIAARLTQVHDGRWVAVLGHIMTLADDFVSHSRFVFLPPHDLRDVVATVTFEEASAAAEAYDRCVREREDGKPPNVHSVEDSGLVIRNGSLARSVTIAYSDGVENGHCRIVRTVHVDAATGAVHGVEPRRCE